MLIWGATKIEHDERLRNALEAACSSSITLNAEKCQSSMSEVTFLGVVRCADASPDKQKRTPAYSWNGDIFREVYSLLRGEDDATPEPTEERRSFRLGASPCARMTKPQSYVGEDISARVLQPKPGHQSVHGCIKVWPWHCVLSTAWH